GHVTADRAVRHCHLRVSVDDDASARGATTYVTVNCAVSYRNCPAASVNAAASSRIVVADDAVRHRQRSATTESDAAAMPRKVVAEDGGSYRQRAATIAVDAAAVGEVWLSRYIVAEDATVAECEASVVKDATPSVEVGGKTVGDGQTGHGDVRSEVFK